MKTCLLCDGRGTIRANIAGTQKQVCPWCQSKGRLNRIRKTSLITRIKEWIERRKAGWYIT